LQADECTPSWAVIASVVANNAVIGKRINPCIIVSWECEYINPPTMAKRKITLVQDFIADLDKSPSAWSFRRKSAIGCSAIYNQPNGETPLLWPKEWGFSR